MYSNAIDASEFTPCEWYGHTYTIEDSAEVYDACVDCGEPREGVEVTVPSISIGSITAQNVTVAHTIIGGLLM